VKTEGWKGPEALNAEQIAVDHRELAVIEIGDTIPWKPQRTDVFTIRGDGDFGALIDSTTRCSKCDKPFGTGHALMIEPRPQMAGIAFHTDCDDPTLEKQ
jgi:hypothetical protein